MTTMASPPTLEDRLLTALSAAGGSATMSELVEQVHGHRNTVRKYLNPLLAAGLVREVAHGRYELGKRQMASPTASELLAVLSGGGYEAHLTGLDVVAPYAHQFLSDYPHLVAVEPTSFEELEFELARHGFIVVPAGPGPKPTGPDLSRAVLLRSQKNASQYGVHGVLAPVEKAWVDSVREVVRGNLSFPYLELGRMLRGIVDAGGNVRYLRRYARQLGYLDRVDAALGKVGTPNRELRALRAGYLS